MCMVSRSAGLKFVDLDIYKLSPPPGRFPVGDPSYDWDIADGVHSESFRYSVVP